MHEDLMLAVGGRSRDANDLKCFASFALATLRADGRQVDCMCKYGAAKLCDTMNGVMGKR